MGKRERGEGRLSSFIWLAVMAILAYGGWNVGPVYIANYTLTDKMKQIAMIPRWTANDDKIYDLLMKYVRDEQMTEYVGRNSFSVVTGEGRRTIQCRYSRTVNVLPGVSHTFDFTDNVEALTP